MAAQDDRKKQCTVCGRKVWVLATEAGPVWEHHIDKAGEACGASGKRA